MTILYQMLKTLMGWQCNTSKEGEGSFGIAKRSMARNRGAKPSNRTQDRATVIMPPNKGMQSKVAMRPTSNPKAPSKAAVRMPATAEATAAPRVVQRDQQQYQLEPV